MEHIENGTHRTNGSSIKVHKSFLSLQTMVGGFLKRILTYLCCIKYNEINVCHSDKYKHASHKKSYFNTTCILYTGSYKSFPILWGENV